MKTVALLSGGIDSTVMAWKLHSEGHTIVPITFLTYRRNPREVEAVKKIAGLISQNPLRIVDMSFLREIVDHPQHVRETIMHAAANLPTVVIPYRNMLFYSAAAHVACLEEANNVAGGHTFEDVVTIPDVGHDFFRQLESLLHRSMPHIQLRILAPLMELRKVDVLRLGFELGAPLDLTWSCWSILDKHCGKCPGCLARKESFKLAGIRDETDYAEG
ncbi:MAG: 7-cyano-7-deazaguanine synthase [Candidatus Caldarchaeum sp.]|uniref:7-cyano-7-deazaguanine synthase n=1 Tax=Caldiarchaeum subterraneum TaxID=311458 RepID=A0A7C5LBC4_CALS0